MRCAFSVLAVEEITGHWWSGKDTSSRYACYFTTDELVTAIDDFTVDNGDTEIWAPKRKKKTWQARTAGNKWGQFPF
jgi:hypothetical protein